MSLSRYPQKAIARDCL